METFYPRSLAVGFPLRLSRASLGPVGQHGPSENYADLSARRWVAPASTSERGRSSAGGLPGARTRPRRPVASPAHVGPLWLDDMVSVGEDEIAEAMVLLMERSKLVVEGAGAVAVAALLEGLVAPAQRGTTVVVLSGGNVDAGLLAAVARRHETQVGRRLALFTRLPDRPGALAGLLACVADAGSPTSSRSSTSAIATVKRSCRAEGGGLPLCARPLISVALERSICAVGRVHHRAASVNRRGLRVVELTAGRPGGSTIVPTHPGRV